LQQGDTAKGWIVIRMHKKRVKHPKAEQRLRPKRNGKAVVVDAEATAGIDLWEPFDR
jgi:hypothetical protein